MTGSRAPFSAVVGVWLMFASNGMIVPAVIAWFPTLFEQLAVTPAVWGLVLASIAIGGITSSALPVLLIRRFGPLRVSVATTAVAATAIALVGWMPAPALLAACLFSAGFADALGDAAQNVAGIRVQARFGRSVISSMHAMWSIGAVAGVSLGTLAAAAGIDIRLHLALSGALCVALVLVGANLARGWVAEVPKTGPIHTRAGMRRRWVTLSAVLPLAALAVSGVLVEDIANAWSGIAAVRLAGIDVSVAGIAGVAALGAQCIGRFSGDWFIQRFGRLNVVRAGGMIIVAGGMVVVFGGAPAPVLAGFALVGFGSATIVPVAFAAAAEIRGVSDGAGVTIVGWIMRLGFLIASPVVGGLTDLVDLRVALVLLPVGGLAVVLLSGALTPAAGAARTRP